MMHCISFFHLSLRKLVLGLICITVLLYNQSVNAQSSEYFEHSSKNTSLEVTKYLDKTASLQLDQIILFSDDQWQATKKQVTGFYFWEADYWAASQGAVLWLKVQLPKDQTQEKVWLELLPNVGMDGKIALFDQGFWGWQEPVKHDSLLNNFQPAKYLTFLFDYSNTHNTAYIRLTTEQTFQFSLKLRAFDQLPSYFMTHSLFFGLVAGMLCLAMIYNFVIGLRAKEPVYLYYAFYVMCNLLYLVVMEGYSRLLFPDWGNSAIVSNSTTILLSFSAIIFIRQFLDTKVSLPRFDILLRGVIALFSAWLVCLSVVPYFYGYLFTIVFGIISPIIGLVAGILSYRQGHPMARYFLIAWFLFLISAGCWGWMWLGIIEPKAWVVWFYLSGTLLEVVLLSMVLGFRFSTLKTQTQTLHAAKSRYRELSETDDLTKLLNRRGFIRSVERQLKNHKNNDLVWLALDIDNFKAFNDKYGHPAGDELLEKMGSLLNEKGRKENVVGRIGGEEFAILLVNCTMSDAINFMNRLLADFALIKIKTEETQQASTTLSIGATAIKPNEKIEPVWKRADKLLYQAKEQGRNRAVVG
jgi:diguanylate cyclase (GGDEF)-like protein